jgi:hypothetical protein
MNLIEGTVRDGAEQALQIAGGALLKLRRAPEGLAGKRVVYGVRPERT